MQITAEVHLRRNAAGIVSSITISIPLLPNEDVDDQIASYIERHFPGWRMCGWPSMY
jgi:hypothetical protein